MKPRIRARDIIVLAALAISACAPAAAEEAETMATQETQIPRPIPPLPTPTPGSAVASETAAPEGDMQVSPEPATQAAAWLETPLIDAVSGVEFRISDYSGKVVLVETMAVWCSKCRSQQEEMQAFHEQLGARSLDVASVSLDIDPNEDAQYLKLYVEQTGFDWTFAIAPAELSRTIGLTYGDQFLNPPSTPLLIIDRNGSAHPLPFGIKSAGELLLAVQPYLEAGA